LCTAVPQALAKAGLPASEVAAVGISAGAHIAVLEDADGRVIRPAIMWNDQRSSAEAAELHERAGETIIAKGLNRANPTWTLCQLAWLQKHEPEAIARTRRLYIAKDWLRSRLTGDWTTDYSDALGALMSDVETRGWSPEICGLIGWDMASLPPVRRPEEVAGRVTAAGARASGLAEGTPVVVGANDTTVELYGAGAIEAGQGAIKLATAGVVFLACDRPEVHPPVSCYPPHPARPVVHGLRHQRLRHRPPLGARHLLCRPAAGKPPSPRWTASLPASRRARTA
jgi:xylulokinase